MISRRVLALAARVGARLPVVVNRSWPLLRRIKKRVLEGLQQNSITRDGHVLYLDPTDSLRLGMGDRHEPETVRLLQHTLRPGDRVVDAGAHIGFLTLHMALAVGCRGTVHAFEPDPGNLALLRKNVAANGYSNVVVEPAAVWSSSGTRRLYLRADHHGDHRCYDPGDGRESIEVKATSLDQHFGAVAPPIRLVKLDIQGSEGHAVRGMTGLLRRNPEIVLVVELWPRGLRECGSGPEDLLDLLARLGFGFWWLGARSGRCVPVAPCALLRQLEPSTRLGRWRSVLRRQDWAEIVCARSATSFET